MCASGRAAGGLSPDAHPELGPRWREVAKRSLDLHRELDAQWDVGLRTLDLRVPPHVVVPAQAHVDPLRLCASLARRAGTIATGTAYEDVTDCARAHRLRNGGRTGRRIGGRTVVREGSSPSDRPLPPVLDAVVTDGRDLLALQLPSGHIVSAGRRIPRSSRRTSTPRCAQITASLRDAVPETATRRSRTVDVLSSTRARPAGRPTRARGRVVRGRALLDGDPAGTRGRRGAQARGDRPGGRATRSFLR